MSETIPVDSRWRDAFVLALRLRDAPPEVIADQLALVQAHCHESGESAEEAFGDPAAYSDVVAREAGVATKGTLRELVDLLPAAAGGFLAAQLTFAGLWGVVGGNDVSLTVGGIAAAVVLIGTAFVLLRLLAQGSGAWVAGAVTGAAVVVAVLLDVADTPLVAEVSPWPVLMAGLVVLGGVVLVSVRSGRRARLLDPVSGRAMF